MNRLFYRAEYLLRETLLGLRRGGWMNGAAVSTVTVLLLLFGIGLQGSWQLGEFLNRYGNQLEISAYLSTGVAAKQVQPAVTALPNVTGVTAITKEEAWMTLGKELGIQDPTAAQGKLGGNPLVDELRIQASNATAVPKLAEALKGIQGIETVQYLGEVVAQITEINENLKAASLGVIGFLTVSAIAVITTTLRLVIAARRQEVEVMRLVGATRGTIYLPFLFQGITFGIVGAIVASGLIQAILATLNRLAARQTGLLQGLLIDTGKSWWLPLILLGLGSAIGLVGSLLAVQNLGKK